MKFTSNIKNMPQPSSVALKTLRKGQGYRFTPDGDLFIIMDDISDGNSFTAINTETFSVVYPTVDKMVHPVEILSVNLEVEAR